MMVLRADRAQTMQPYRRILASSKIGSKSRPPINVLHKRAYKLAINIVTFSILS
jgi:hypothetical protein